MAKGKFSKPRSSRDDNALPMEPEIPGLSEDLAQELLLDELTQDASAWGEVTDQPEEEPEVVVVLPAEPQPEPQEPEESATEAETPEEVAAEPVILPEEPEEIPAREEIPAEPVTEMFILPEDPDETAVLPETEEPEDFSEPEEPEVSPKIKKHKKIAMISLCCAALLILGGIVAAVSILMSMPEDDGLILNNVTVAGVNLGGMTLEQAEQALLAATKDTYTQQDMVINLPGATISC